MAISSTTTPISRHHSGRGSIGLPRLTLILAAFTVVLYALAGPAPESLVFDRLGIANGELWRLFTGHWVHSDGEHLLWNVAGLLVLGWLFEPLLRTRTLAVLLLGSVGIDLFVWYEVAGLQRYCGLSGVLNTLLAAGLCLQWKAAREPLVIVAGAAAVAKIAIEMLNATALFTHSSWPSVPAVHAVGFAAGILWWALSRIQSVADRRKRLIEGQNDFA